MLREWRPQGKRRLRRKGNNATADETNNAKKLEKAKKLEELANVILEMQDISQQNIDLMPQD
jgi:hypothetical protein